MMSICLLKYHKISKRSVQASNSILESIVLCIFKLFSASLRWTFKTCLWSLEHSTTALRNEDMQFFLLFFKTQLLSVQSILSGDMSLWAICILICFSWFLCWEFVEAHDLHGERPQHQSTHYHSAHYHQRHRRHWVSTLEQFVECLWCRVNYDGPPDHKKIRQKFVYFSVFLFL